MTGSGVLNNGNPSWSLAKLCPSVPFIWGERGRRRRKDFKEDDSETAIDLLIYTSLAPAETVETGSFTFISEMNKITSAVMADSYRIQISSSLVDKLVSDGEKTKKKPKKLKPKLPQEPHKNKHNPTPTPTTPPIWPVQPPVFVPVAPPPPASPSYAELEAIRSTMQQSEEIMKRLQVQEANMTQELTQRAKELREKEFKLPFQKSMPCGAERDACLECYKEQQESKQPLKCAQVVKSYRDCVIQARQQKQHQANSAS